MNILHTESSPGWGGQELRILKEAEGMRSHGHSIVMVIQKGGGLVQPAKQAGFVVYELSFQKKHALQILFQLIRIMLRHKIDVINTHSSLDAWIGGLAGKLLRCRVIRTRHLSTPVRKGLNSLLLYNLLCNKVVTTCEAASIAIRSQAKLPVSRCLSIPTGIDPKAISVNRAQIEEFRKSLGLKSEDILVGTLCVLRGWKGVSDLLKAAKILEPIPHLKWVIVGSGASEEYFKQEWRDLKLEDKVFFTGHLSPPFTALAAMDLFMLLSWAHEGVSQASLQAAWLEKPLITTSTGGLNEVCIDGKTGLIVPIQDPSAVACAVKHLLDQPEKRKKMGAAAKELVCEKFLMSHMLDKMEAVMKL